MGRITYRLYVKNKHSVKNREIFKGLGMSTNCQTSINEYLNKSTECTQLVCLDVIGQYGKADGAVTWTVDTEMMPSVPCDMYDSSDGQMEVYCYFENGKEVNDFCKRTLPIFKKYGKFTNNDSVSSIKARILDEIPSRWAKFWAKLGGKERGKRYLWNLSDGRKFDNFVTGSFSVDLKN